MIPVKAQKRTIWSGTPRMSSWNTAETKKTSTIADHLDMPSLREG